MVKAVSPELNALSRKSEWENAEEIHDGLRRAILKNELPAGMILNQVHLAKRLGVSRTPLREAMRMLQREGLIEGESYKRLRVSSLSLRGLEDLYAMRILLEGLAIRLSVPHLGERTQRNQKVPRRNGTVRGGGRL